MCQEVQIRMRVHIDETGGKPVSLGVDESSVSSWDDGIGGVDLGDES